MKETGNSGVFTMEDAQAPMGKGATREMGRALASVGKLEQADPIFGTAKSVSNAGVLLLLPALIAQGLLKGMDVYGSIKKNT